MQITIAAIGKLKAGPELDLFEHYHHRLKWKIHVKEYDIKKQISGEERKAQEAELLLGAVKDCDHVIALDEHGQMLGSQAFAKHLQTQRDQGKRDFACVIGGADGLHASVHKRAGLILSMGRLTWPHLLVRGLIAEQLYRAHCILGGHPYHRE